MSLQSILSTLKNAASELQIGQLLKQDSFSLEETILTIDILKPNMDIYADCSKSWNELQRRLMEFQHSFLMQPILTNFQLQSLIRGMLIGLLNWIHGASIHRTLFCSPLLLRHREVANPILTIFSRLIGCISEEFTKAALLTGMMNEEDLSSDSAQFRLMYKFASPLELDKFLADSKAQLKGNEELVVIFDLLTALHQTFHSFKGDILYQLDYAKNALALLAEKSRELSKFWKGEFPHSSRETSDFYGLFPFFDASCSIFPPKEPILDLESVNVLVHLSEEVVPVLERFLTTIESLNGTALMVFFFRCQFHVKADAFKRIALANWTKHLYEYHLASSPSLFAFPWSSSEQMTLEDLNSIFVVLLYFCRNASWIHRKAVDFTRKVILEQLECGDNKSKERTLILRFLFGQVHLKRLELGFALGLVTPNETEKRLSKQLLHLGIAKQQQLVPDCQLLWEYWSQLSKEYAVMEEKLDLSKLDPVIRRRFHLDLLEEMWRLVVLE